MPHLWFEGVDFYYKFKIDQMAIVGNAEFILINGQKIKKVEELTDPDFGKAHFYSPVCVQKRLKECKNLEVGKVNLVLDKTDSIGGVKVKGLFFQI